jgi:hypothetical protein
VIVQQGRAGRVRQRSIQLWRTGIDGEGPHPPRTIAEQQRVAAGSELDGLQWRGAGNVSEKPHVRRVPQPCSPVGAPDHGHVLHGAAISRRRQLQTRDGAGLA